MWWVCLYLKSACGSVQKEFTQQGVTLQQLRKSGILVSHTGCTIHAVGTDVENWQALSVQ